MIDVEEGLPFRPLFDPKVTPIEMGRLYRVLSQGRQIYEDMLKVCVFQAPHPAPGDPSPWF